LVARGFGEQMRSCCVQATGGGRRVSSNNAFRAEYEISAEMEELIRTALGKRYGDPRYEKAARLIQGRWRRYKLQVQFERVRSEGLHDTPPERRAMAHARQLSVGMDGPSARKPCQRARLSTHVALFVQIRGGRLERGTSARQPGIWRMCAKSRLGVTGRPLAHWGRHSPLFTQKESFPDKSTLTPWLQALRAAAESAPAPSLTERDRHMVLMKGR
jgi:hypothetical protein